jgi:hypothetical protein
MCAVLEKCLLDDILQARLQGAETGRAELAGARHRVDRFLELQKITEGLHGRILFFRQDHRSLKSCAETPLAPQAEIYEYWPAAGEGRCSPDGEYPAAGYHRGSGRRRG